MPPPCKVCNFKHREEIEEKIREGLSYAKIEEFAKLRGLEVAGNNIYRHAIMHMSDYEEIKKSRDKKQIKESESLKIDVDLILKSEGFKDVNSQSFDDFLSASQVISQRIIITHLVLFQEKLNDHIQGKDNYPSSELRGLRDLLQALSPILGIEVTVNLNKAIQTINKAGYLVRDENDRDVSQI